MTLYLAFLAFMGASILAGFAIMAHFNRAPYTRSEAEDREAAELAERRTKREVELGLESERPSKRWRSAREAEEAEHRRQAAMAEELREERHLTRAEAEEVRDGLLASLAKRAGVNLTGPKGESLIRHGKALPTSVLETFDRGREVFCELKGLEQHYDLTLRIQLKVESNVHLRVRRARAVSHEQVRWTQGLDTGDVRFDRTYLLEGKGFVSIEPLQQLPEARAAVDQIFTLDGTKVLSIHRGLLRIEGELDADLDRDDLARLLPALRVLASIYEGEAPALLELKAHAVVGTERLCPYCRDAFEDDELEVIECGGCGTALHDECHQENGGCPVLGCGLQEKRRASLPV